MNAFAVAAQVLAADANLGADAVYVPSATVRVRWVGIDFVARSFGTFRAGDQLPMRVNLSLPDVTQRLSVSAMTDAEAMAMVPVATLAQPRAGDVMTINAEVWTVVAFERDAERVSWRLGLRAAAATTPARTALAAAIPA